MAKRTVMWFRRDLRLDDHLALEAACATGEVVPLFVDDPALRAVSGAARLAYLHDCLRALDDLMGGALVVRRGDPVEVVAAVAAEVGASEVFVTRDHSPLGRQRDQGAAERLAADDRRLVGVGTNYVVAPGTVRKADETPYAVFTPFFRNWADHARRTLDELGDESGATRQPSQPTWVRLESDGLPARVDPGCELPDAGPESAHRRWQQFVDTGLADYPERRDLPAVDGTSQLSAALKWGTIHPRTLLADLLARAEFETNRVYISELAWREFYADVLFHRPETAWNNLNRSMDAMVLDTDRRARERFDRWCAGQTGFGIVDAGMRQLLATGWMHNRVRMIVASFLVKDLHLPWQWGAAHFMNHLVDGDIASNNHGWQWAAGTGTDAAPYFRVFNPITQQKRYDPDGAYVARWVPEAGTSEALEPMVDHAAERAEALERYRNASGR